jgi:hypothetical protein
LTFWARRLLSINGADVAKIGLMPHATTRVALHFCTSQGMGRTSRFFINFKTSALIARLRQQNFVQKSQSGSIRRAAGKFICDNHPASIRRRSEQTFVQARSNSQTIKRTRR